MIPISKDVIAVEIDLAQRVLKKWQDRFAAGIPGQEMPADEYTAELFVNEFCSELFLVAKKLESIAEIVAQSQI